MINLKCAGAIAIFSSLLWGCGAKDAAQDLPAAPSEAKTENSSCLASLPGPVKIKAGEAIIGNDRAYREEAPARIQAFESFDIDAHEVTNDDFAKFVKKTGYVTTAEKDQPGFGKPGAAIFKEPTATHPGWWWFIEGANWRAPTGPDSNIEGKGNHPVVQVSHEDAMAYAKWAGRALPSEAQWEYAAQAGSNSLYVWGEQLVPNEKHQANTWQGIFPLQNSEDDGYDRSAPAGCYKPNAFGLYDMIGNVWEWTDTEYQETKGEKIFAIKGGSFLCAPSYCKRYRASARQPQEAGFSTNHIGFRTVSRRLD